MALLRWSPVPPPPPLAGLTSVVASAARINGKTALSHSGRKEQGWQNEAWHYFETVGELGYVVDQTARTASKARMRVMKRPPVPGDDPVALDPASASDRLAGNILGAVGGGPAGMAMLINSVVGHLLVPGESYLVGSPDDLAGEQSRMIADVSMAELHWQALSASEMKVVKGGGYEINLGGGKRFYSEDSLYVVHVWQPDRRFSRQATSPIRRNLAVLRELEALTADIAAVIDSRLTGPGLLLVPQEGTFPTNPEDDLNGVSGVDRFMIDFVDAVTSAVEGRGTAEALAPIIAQVPGDTINQWRLIEFAKDLVADTKILRDELIRRLALGLDAPPSILLGLDDSNDWSSWTITHDYVESHIEPLLVTVAAAFTTAILQPALQASGVADFDTYVVWPDVTDLTASPAREGAATDAYDRLVITAAALRRELGFDEGDAPSVEEQAAQMLRLIGRIPAGALEVVPLLLRHLGSDDLANDVERLASFFGGVTEEDVLIQTAVTSESDQRRSGSTPGAAPTDRTPTAVPGTRPEGRPANDPGAP